MKTGMWVGKILIMLVIAIGVAFGIGIGTMYLWNWLVPELFNGPIINFWKTVGLLALSKIFLWSFGRKCHGHQGQRAGGAWKYYWKDKYGKMSPEDRERFKEKMKEKWCYKEGNTQAGC